jgi:hypothetical protein
MTTPYPLHQCKLLPIREGPIGTAVFYSRPEREDGFSLDGFRKFNWYNRGFCCMITLSVKFISLDSSLKGVDFIMILECVC